MSNEPEETVSCWRLRVYELQGTGEGSEIYRLRRACTTGDNAKTWGRNQTRGILQEYPAGVRCVIFDPSGRRWAEADVTPASHPLRMRWV